MSNRQPTGSNNENMIRGLIESTLEVMPVGFRKGRNANGWIFALSQIYEKILKQMMGFT